LGEIFFNIFANLLEDPRWATPEPVTFLCSALEKLDWNANDSGGPKKVGADFNIPRDLNIVVLGNEWVPWLTSQSIMLRRKLNKGWAHALPFAMGTLIHSVVGSNQSTLASGVIWPSWVNVFYNEKIREDGAHRIKCLVGETVHKE
jgi:hypothetical protein